MEEAWEIYYEELLRGAGEIHDQLWNREDDVREAAHDAYQSTVDRLIELEAYTDEQAVELGKAFGRVVKEWIDEGSFDVDELAEMLEERQAQWEEKQVGSF
jgi:hypothetical protein